MKTRITAKNAPVFYGALKQFYIDQILLAAERAGSQDALSESLGRNWNCVQMTLRRNSFAALERLYREIRKPA